MTRITITNHLANEPLYISTAVPSTWNSLPALAPDINSLWLYLNLNWKLICSLLPIDDCNLVFCQHLWSFGTTQIHTLLLLYNYSYHHGLSWVGVPPSHTQTLVLSQYRIASVECGQVARRRTLSVGLSACHACAELLRHQANCRQNQFKYCLLQIYNNVTDVTENFVILNLTSQQHHSDKMT